MEKVTVSVRTYDLNEGKVKFVQIYKRPKDKHAARNMKRDNASAYVRM